MPLINLQKLLKGQKTLLKSTEPLIIWYGSVRSGKGVGAANWMLDKAIRDAVEGRGNRTHILGGSTMSSFVRNNEPYITDIAEQAGLSVKLKNDVKGPHYDIEGIKFYVFGGDNKRSYYPVRGITAHNAWVDEVTLCDEQFVTTIAERCSFDDSQMVLTTNADNPLHWLKLNWIDSEIEGRQIITSDFEENIHYSDERRGVLKKLNPHTANYKRAIQNLWAGAEGMIIPIQPEHYDEKKHPLIGDVFLDPGTAGTTAAVLFNRTGIKKFTVVDEYYHIGDIQGRLTDEEHIDRILAKGWQISSLFVDPAGASMKAAAQRKGLHPRNAPNSFESGVQAANNALYSGDLKINPKCQYLLMEASGYIWNPQGTKPVTTPDHLMDCLRYGSLQHFPAYTSQLLYTAAM